MKRLFYFSLILYVMFNLSIKKKENKKQYLRHSFIPNLLQHVDVFYGTGVTSGAIESTGNLFPISALPFGNNHWTVTTNGKSPWFFDRRSNKFYGIRCSHQPSPWIGDYAFFDMSPSENPLIIETYDITPSKLSVIFKDHSKITLIPTETGAVMTFVGIEKMILKRMDYKIIDDYTIIGKAIQTSVFKAPEHTILHIVIKSSTLLKNKLEINSSTIWRIGTSFIDETQAFNNVPTSDPQSILFDNDRQWNKLLGRVIVKGNSSKHKFYSMLYRTLLFPRLLKESNGKHYSPYSKKGDVYYGEISTDSGFWDAYRTVYPLLHLVYPDYASRILNGWVNAIKESTDGMLTQWASPAKVNSMEGSMGEISIAEGIMNNVIDDVDTAWQYLYKSCFTNAGRSHFDEYDMLGFVPQQVSLSLNYYLSDYVVSIVARHLGYFAEADKLLKRSKNWKLIFNRDTKLFESKSKDGNFTKWDQYRWMGPYREGGPWQYRFYVPHDPIELNNWGYDGKMCEYLNDMMTNNYRPKNTINMIHEEKELYNHMFGQYAHNNQPVHHILYMFHHVGCRQEGEKWIHKVLEESYTDTGYPGDEDNGEMSAWYILSSIGLYSLVPGTLQYQMSSSPLWDNVDIDNGRIIIERSKNSKNRAAIINYSNEKKYRIQT